MNVFPAIDLRGGRVVRLVRGDFGAETDYGDDAVQVARSFEAAGAPWIHVVDLDAARTGEARNRLLVGAIAEAVDVPVQAGGGVRDRQSAEALLDSGVARIVVGTAATEQSGLVEWLAGHHPGRIAVGIDARRGQVAVRGWTSGSRVTALDLFDRFRRHPVAAFVVTDIDRDGTLGGPDHQGLATVLGAAAEATDVIASGGVGTLADLGALAGLEVGSRRLAGVIVGKALYEGRFTVAEAVDACRPPS